jgi:hypothetical protein
VKAHFLQSDSKVPDQKELEKELNEYLGKKYGDRIRLVVPMLFPKTQAEEIPKEEKEFGKYCTGLLVFGGLGE